MTALPGAIDPLLNRIRRRRGQAQGTFGPISSGNIGFDERNPFGGLLGEAGDPAAGGAGSNNPLLSVLSQFARAGIPLPGPVAAIQGLPTFTGAGPDPRSGGGGGQQAPGIPGSAGPGVSGGAGGPSQPAQPLQSVNSTGLTIGGPTTSASLARLAPAGPINNPLRITSNA